MKNSSVKIKTADDYVSLQPPEYREMLENLRVLVRKLIPTAKEMISYQVICYKTEYMLVGLGTAKGYCSFYPMSSVLIKKLKNEMKGLLFSGTTLHIPLDAPIPVAAIKKIIRARLEENKLRLAARRKN